MNVGKTLYICNRREWRSWLSKNHVTAKEIWLIYYKKHSGKKRIAYNDAVEEALCYGWIDSIIKKRNAESYVQRFSPRRRNSLLSEMNKERIRRLIKAKKMTHAGLEILSNHLSSLVGSTKKFVVPADILSNIRKHPAAWKNFRRFPLSYKRVRIGWIDESRARPDIFRRRLQYFISMTEKNKRFGMLQ